jgi:hypothetical protein
MHDMPLHDAILIENGAVTRVNRIVRAIERNATLAAQFKKNGLSGSLVQSAENVAAEVNASRKAERSGRAPVKDASGRTIRRGDEGSSPFAQRLSGKTTWATESKKPLVKLGLSAKVAIAEYIGVKSAFMRGVVAKQEHLYGKGGSWTTTARGAVKLSGVGKTGKGAKIKDQPKQLKKDKRSSGSYATRGAAGSDAAYRAMKKDLRAKHAQRDAGGKFVSMGAGYYSELEPQRASRRKPSSRDESILTRYGGKEYHEYEAKSRKAKTAGQKQAASVARQYKRHIGKTGSYNNPFGYDDYGALALENPSGIAPLDMIESTLSGIPGVKYFAPVVTPVAMGAAAFGIHFLAVPQLERVLPEQAKPFAYTIGGSAVGVLCSFVAVKSSDETVKNAAALLGGAAVTIGVALDLFRKFGGGSTAGDDEFGALALENPGVFGALALENRGVFGALALENPGVFGDGMAYELGPVGGFGYDGESASLRNGYAAASLADAYFSGPDFDALEGEALLAGPAEFRRAAGPISKSAAGARKAHSNHAGRRFHRWGWLIKLIGPENAQKIAALSPDERLRVIENLRKQALEIFQREVAALNRSNSALPAGIPAGGPMAPAAAPGIGDTFGYGALAVADY